MQRWAVIFTDKPEMNNIRADRKTRDAHVAYAMAHPELVIGGGLKPSPEADFCGALWIVDADTRDAVEALIKEDPFFVPAYRNYQIFTWGKILEDQSAIL
ncbi:YciI family protein [Aliiroseovarius sp. F20344]|uniref:YciI family protein n=1 Tax=Aliiroseovarius sp. F20344 TaxID=2926414 RepID=UPI001FF52587|nr:YciI family protein [Aliiroseovarius sp. F20344]MCK0142506.1 YciI family protein [Aliiroseovarius sp. F20344]